MIRSLAIALLFAAGCSSGGAGNASSAGDGTYGALGMTANVAIRLVDAPTQAVTQIVVTFDQVSAHVVGGGGWVDLANQTTTVDLLQLQGGTFALLGLTALPAGKVTELRLHTVDAGPNYVTTPDGLQHPLTVPSGDESGIKIKGGFDLPACASGNITLDFDGKNSIFTHPVGGGAGDEWILRPVIRLKEVSLSGGCDDGSAAGGGGSASGGGGGSTSGGGGGSPTVPDGGGSGTDGGVPIVSMPGDPCLTTVTCPDGDYCSNGACVAPIG